jgi:hypothetical protein
MDDIFRSFLAESYLQSAALVAESDILHVVPYPLTALPTVYFPVMTHVASNPPTMYLVLFEDMVYLSATPTGTLEVTTGVLPVEVRFPPDYLCSTDPILYLKLATLLDPWTFALPHVDFFHPNHDPITGAICLGADFRAATPLPPLIWHIDAILTYANFSVDERNALNPTACRYWRDHPEAVSELPIKPLRRRRLKAMARA